MISFFTAILLLCTIYVDGFKEYCGATIGYNLTNLGQSDFVIPQDYGLFTAFAICGRIHNPICAAISYVGCQAYASGALAGVEFGPQPVAPWSYINTQDPLQGVNWRSEPTIDTTPVWRSLNINLTCNPMAIQPVIVRNFGVSTSTVVLGQLGNYTQMMTIETNLVCGNPTFPPIAHYSPTASADSIQSSGTDISLQPSSSTGSVPGCNGASLQSLYFSYTAIISSTYTISVTIVPCQG